MKRFLLLGMVLCTTTSCGGIPPVPTDHFYRLTLPDTTMQSQRISEEALQVGRYQAEGLYNERALIYTTDPAGRELKQYHYHFWITPPPSLLRDYLINYLRARESAVVILPDAYSANADLINGRVLAFEKYSPGNVSVANIIIELSYRKAGEDAPLLIRQYTAREAIEGETVLDTVTAFNTGTGKIYKQFLEDIQALLKSE